jgi:hypothetical protein
VSPEERARLFADLSRGGLFPYACNKAYRRGFLQGDCLPFEQTKLIEDFLFNIHAFGVAGRIDAIAPALYYYRKPVHETLASQFNPEFFHLALRKYDLEQQFLRQCGCQDPALWNLVHENMVKHIISAAVRNRSPKAGYTPRQRRQRIAEMVTDPAVEALLRDYTPRNRVYRIICAWMGRKRVTLLGLLAWMVQLMQTKMKPLYQKVLGR